jgi:guanylate kinase
MSTSGGAARPQLLVLSGTSGAGKTTLAQALLRDPRYGRARTATTRAPRAGEVDGVDYDFLTEAAFRAGVARGEFVEHAVVYGRLYGTPRANLEAILDSGRNCVLVVDVQGVANLRRQTLGAVTTYVFVEAPGPEELRRRLEGRGKDDPETIERRLRAAAREREEAEGFDLVLVNDVVESAVQRLVAHAGLDWAPHLAEE